MRRAASERVYYCPVEVSLDKIGGKWKPLILWHLRARTRRFRELKRLIPNVTEKMLTEKLRELESDGLIHREVYREVPPKVEYSLTPYGRGLDPILQQLCQWGKQHARKNRIRIEPLAHPETGSVHKPGERPASPRS
jgi:DNA-binding HxlR family transcriptional regulator